MGKYEEALKRAKQGMPIEQIFPELADSEDERIRKWLIELIKSTDANHSNMKLSENCKLALAYLERQKEQKPVKLNDDTEVGLDRALQIVKAAKGNLCGYQSDDGIYECDHAIQTLEHILKNGIEQKPAECLKPEKDCWYVCIKDFYCGGKKQSSKGDLVQAKGGMYMMGREDISEWFRKAYYDEIKPAKWSEEDERLLNIIIDILDREEHNGHLMRGDLKACVKFLKSLRPQPKPSWSEEDEKMLWSAINGLNQDIYEKERNWLANRLKCIGHFWKPSEEQMEFLKRTVDGYDITCRGQVALESLYDDLKKL